MVLEFSQQRAEQRHRAARQRSVVLQMAAKRQMERLAAAQKDNREHDHEGKHRVVRVAQRLGEHR